MKFNYGVSFLIARSGIEEYLELCVAQETSVQVEARCLAWTLVLRPMEPWDPARSMGAPPAARKGPQQPRGLLALWAEAWQGDEMSQLLQGAET